MTYPSEQNPFNRSIGTCFHQDISLRDDSADSVD